MRGWIDVDLPSGHAIAKVPRDPRVRPDTKRSPGDLDITAYYTVEDDRAPVRQETLLHGAFDLNRPTYDIGVPPDDRGGIQFDAAACNSGVPIDGSRDVNLTTRGPERSMDASGDCLLPSRSEIIPAGYPAEAHVAAGEDCVARHAVHDRRRRSRRDHILAAPRDFVLRLFTPAARERRHHERGTRQCKQTTAMSLEHH